MMTNATQPNHAAHTKQHQVVVSGERLTIYLRYIGKARK